MSENLEFARKVVAMEAAAISNLTGLLGVDFERAVHLATACEGMVVVCGIGKAGQIGQKVSATLASTGTPSFFLHPAEAFHGDLGRIRSSDLVILMSHSGESNEVVQLIGPIRSLGATLIGITGKPESTLAKNVDLVLDCGRPPEACPLGLAPTASTAAMLALGDALAMTVLNGRNFTPRDYARFHPGGELGRRLMTVDEIMRRDDRITVVTATTDTRGVLLAMNETKGRPGAAMIVDDDGHLVGFFTDGDIARNLQEGGEFLSRTIRDVMNVDPVSISPFQLASVALRLLRERKIDQIPVVDDDHRPVGLVDVQDLMDARII